MQRDAGVRLERVEGAVGGPTERLQRRDGPPVVPYFAPVPAPRGPVSAAWFRLEDDDEHARPPGSTSTAPADLVLPENFGDALDDALADRGWSPGTAAKRLGVTEPRVEAWCRADGPPRRRQDRERVVRVLPELREALERRAAV